MASHEEVKSAVHAAVAKYVEHKKNGRDHGSAFQATRVSLGHTMPAEAWESVEDYLRKTAIPEAEKAAGIVLKELFNLDPDPK
jgi:hypothetical protein